MDASRAQWARDLGELLNGVALDFHVSSLSLDVPVHNDAKTGIAKQLWIALRFHSSFKSKCFHMIRPNHRATLNDCYGRSIR